MNRKIIRINLFYIKYWIIFFIIFMSAVINYNHGIAPLFYLFFTPCILLSSKFISNKSVKHLFAVFSILHFFLIFSVFFGIFYHYDEPDPIGSIIPWASRNGITSYLIVIHIAYSLVFYLQKNTLPIFYTVLIFIISLYGLGRGSIIASLLLLFISLIINLLVTKKWSYRIIFFSIIIILILFYFFNDNANYLIQNINDGIQKTQFGQGMVDEGRAKIINDYINKLNIWNFLFGANFNNTSINIFFGGNPHNSFIRLHSFYGFFGFLFLFIPIINLLFYETKFTVKFIFLLLIFVALFRSITEPIFFPTTLDYFYSFYFFFFFNHAKLISKNKNTLTYA